VINRVTVWHDDDCPFCQREIALMRRLDTRGAITFAVDMPSGWVAYSQYLAITAASLLLQNATFSVASRAWKPAV
jgi:predicted DCC family thiol-disulfide oxidoreductase YuxK